MYFFFFSSRKQKIILLIDLLIADQGQLLPLGRELAELSLIAYRTCIHGINPPPAESAARSCGLSKSAEALESKLTLFQAGEEV